jgi:hypothetical protein
MPSARAFLVLCSLSFSVAACGGAATQGATPLSPTATYANGAVLEKGQKVLTVEEAHPDPSTTTYSLRGADGQPQAALALFRRAEGLAARADFPTLNRTYSTVYPTDTSIVDVLKAWEEKGVLPGGKASLDGLKSYCDDRSIELVDTNAPKKDLPAPQ